MATYSNIGIKLITTGDESGTWGDSTNNNFSDVLDEAIAGAVTYNISSDADFTLTVSDGTSSDARHAVIKFTSTTLSATRTCTFAPNDLQKTWVVINATTGGQSLTFKQGSSGGTVTVPNGESAIIYSDGAGATNGAITRVLDSFTNTKITTGTLNATTLDLTNLEVTNIKAKDGTAAMTVADSTGVVSFSANPTLSGGTANGVLYLNGSKVATSGSALTFDGTTLANINSDGTGFSTQSAASNFSIMRFGTDSVNGYAFFQSGKSGTGTTLPFAWRQDSSELMRLTATGLGIGTSSPATTLHVNSGTYNVPIVAESTDPNVYIVLKDDTTTGPVGDAPLAIGGSGDNLLFRTNSLERLRITSAGNVGIGTSSPDKKLVVAASNDTSGENNTLKFLDTDTSTAAGQQIGKIEFVESDGGGETLAAYIQSQAEGTSGAGNLIFGTGAAGVTASEKLRITSAGNVGIGTSSPSSRLHLSGAATADARLTFTQTTAGLSSQIQQGSTGMAISALGSQAVLVETNGVERMRINSSGNLLLGTTASVTSWASGRAMDLQVTAATSYPGISTYAYSTAANAGSMLILGRSRGSTGVLSATNSGDGLGYLAFEGVNSSNALTSPAYIAAFQDGAAGVTNIPGRISFYISSGSANPVERMRLDSSGNLLVGRTTYSGYGKINVEGGADFTGGNVLLCRDTGNVGIGTASPAKLLDLAANNTGITTGDPGNILRFSDTDTTSAADQPFGRIEWYSADSDGAGVKAYIQGQSQDGSPDGNLVFATHYVSGGGLAERMRLDYAGNVGIGTSSPANKLHVYNDVQYAYTARFTGPTGGSLVFDAPGDTNTLYLGTDWLYVGAETFIDSNRTLRISATTAQYWQVGGSERMRLNSSGNLGIGTSSPTDTLGYGRALDIQSNAGAAVYLRDSDNTSEYTSLGYEGGTAKNFSIYNTAAGDVRIYTSGSQRLTVNSSGNVGIGTSSPAYKLDVLGAGAVAAVRINNATAGKSAMLVQSNGATAGVIGLTGFLKGDSSTNLGFFAETGFDLRFYTNGSATEKAVIDTSGNLGLGVTPQSWGVGKSLAVGDTNSGFLYGGGNEMILGSNAYFNSGWKYAGTGYANLYWHINGQHQWHIAPSGTAGNAISFTQAMTLDASGNLIGGGKTSSSLTAAGFELTSDGSLRSTKSSTNTNLATNNGGSLQLANSSATDGNFSNIGAYNSNGLVVSQIDFINVSHASRTGDIAFLTHNGSSLLERARITAGGDVGIGTTSPVTSAGGGLTVGSTSSGKSIAIYSSDNGNNGILRLYQSSGVEEGQLYPGNGTLTLYSTSVLRFGTNGAERARIDSAGNLLLGTTTNIGTAPNIVVKQTSAGQQSFTAWNATTSGDPYFLEFGTEASYTARGSITYNRGAGQVAYNTTSDARLKENIADAEEAGSKIDAMQVRQFDWKETGNHLDYGFVAQELHSVAPHAVSKPEDVDAMWSVDYSKLVPMLVKEIQSLRARVAQLEEK